MLKSFVLSFLALGIVIGSAVAHAQVNDGRTLPPPDTGSAMAATANAQGAGDNQGMCICNTAGGTVPVSDANGNGQTGTTTPRGTTK